MKELLLWPVDNWRSRIVFTNKAQEAGGRRAIVKTIRDRQLSTGPNDLV